MGKRQKKPVENLLEAILIQTCRDNANKLVIDSSKNEDCLAMTRGRKSCAFIPPPPYLIPELVRKIKELGGLDDEKNWGAFYINLRRKDKQAYSRETYTMHVRVYPVSGALERLEIEIQKGKIPFFRTYNILDRTSP